MEQKFYRYGIKPEWMQVNKNTNPKCLQPKGSNSNMQ